MLDLGRDMEEAWHLMKMQDSCLVSQPLSGHRRPMTPRSHHSSPGRSCARNGIAQSRLRSPGSRPDALFLFLWGRQINCASLRQTHCLSEPPSFQPCKAQTNERDPLNSEHSLTLGKWYRSTPHPAPSPGRMERLRVQGKVSFSS